MSHQDAAGDAVLLERFAAQRDESAFAALLARHGPMVLGVCRRVLRDTHEAEDVFQAVFLVLARKAAILRRPQSLAAWLYGTARHLAMKVGRGDARRRQRERDRLRTVSVSTDPLDELAARELLLILDEEMERLPETYRLPLLLCGLEGRTQEEAARILGWTAGSLKGRLERGRKQLHARLSRRGLAFSGALLMLGVTQGGAASAAAQLTAETLQTALAFARGECGGISTEVVALAESAVTRMTAAKAKMGLALLLVASLAAGTGVLAYQVRTQEQRPSERSAESKAVAPKPAAEKQAAKDRFGDPLPPGALRRLGTIRLRHGGHVMSVAFAPDGKTAVSGGFDGWAIQWDVQTGKRLRQFHQWSIRSVAIDPAGKTVALASESDNGVKIYELATGKERAACPGHRGGTGVAVFSPDGKQLASCGKDKRIRVWDAATLREVRSWQAGRDEVYRLRFTPDGKSLVSADAAEQTLRFWDAATGAERPRHRPLADLRVSSFCFSADGKTLLTGSNTAPGLLQLWDLTTGEEVRTVARTQGGIGQVALASDGKSVWTVAWGDGPRQWDLSTGKQLLQLPHPPDTIHSLCLSPDGKRLATGTHGHDVFLWDTTTGRRTLDFVGHRSLTTASVFTPDGQHLWTGGFDQTIRCWSVGSGEQLRLFALEGDKSENVFSLALHPDSNMLAVAIIRKKIIAEKPQCDVRLWDLTTGKERKPLHGHADWVSAVAFSPDGRLLASRGEDQTIRLWDVVTGKERSLLRCQEAGAKAITFSPDGLRVISALDKETVGFWDVETGRLSRRLSAGPSGGNSIPLLSRDGRLLITGGGDQPLHLWEVASGKERCRIERPKAKAYVTVALSPDCRILAYADYGQPIKLWDLLAGKQLGEVGDRTNMADALSLIFSLDGRRLASTHSDGTALIWDVARLSPKAGTAATISAKRLEELWYELADTDAAKAYRALRTLAATPAQSVPLLHLHLSKSASADAAKIARLLTDLDSEQFAARERASRELEGLGMASETAVRRVLRKGPSLEVRRRLEQILDKLESSARTTEELRILRAVEVLERIGSSDARRFLEDLARGSPDDWLAQEARAALERLSRCSATKP
jgi:RNA polymerase sigma factor (sigma-70 family)